METEHGVGSAFQFSLAFQQYGEVGITENAPDASWAELAALTKPFHRSCLLVVDDQESNQVLTKEMLDKLGFESVCVGSGQEALDTIVDQRFAAVLMDIQMPNMDGYETTRRIIDRLGGQAPPVIAVTAAAMEQHRLASLGAGMVDHINKPIDPASLANVLVKHLQPLAAGKIRTRLLDNQEWERLGQSLCQLEQKLDKSDFLATRLVNETAELLLGTAFASAFAPVAEATRKFAFKPALLALAKFREAIATDGPA